MWFPSIITDGLRRDTFGLDRSISAIIKILLGKKSTWLNDISGEYTDGKQGVEVEELLHDH